MLYSHIWDLLLKLAAMFALAILAHFLHLEEWLLGIGVPSAYTMPAVVAMIAVAWIVVCRQALSIVGAWLYARASLGADVSLDDARQLIRLFQLDLSFHWVPLKEIKQLPKAERRNALLAKLETLGPRRKAMFL
jgi:hypothetical protein